MFIDKLYYKLHTAAEQTGTAFAVTGQLNKVSWECASSTPLAQIIPEKRITYFLPVSQTRTTIIFTIITDEFYFII